jgi:hypothetical protein
MGHSTVSRFSSAPCDDLDGYSCDRIAEIVGIHWERGRSVRDYLTSFLTAPGVVSLLMFLLFAAMPTLVTRAGSVSRPNDTAEAEDL